MSLLVAMPPYNRHNGDDARGLIGDVVILAAMAPSGMARGKTPKSTELRDLVCARFKAAAEAWEPNQAKLARELDIDPKVLNKYYQAVNYPDELVLVKFCALSDCTMDWIYRGRMSHGGIPTDMAALIGVHYPHLVLQQAAQVRRVPEQVEAS